MRSEATARKRSEQRKGVLAPAAGLSLEPAALSVELLNTAACALLLPQLNRFEDEIFGPEFCFGEDVSERWVRSGCWICAAVTGQAVVGRRQIFSLLSLMIATSASSQRLLAGHAAETELDPWSYDPVDSRPAVYLASVVSAAPDHLAQMYSSVAAELKAFREDWDAEFGSGFSIASGPAGYSHMFRNGFRQTGVNYRGHFPLMTIDAGSAATPFWQSLFAKRATQTRTSEVRRAGAK